MSFAFTLRDLHAYTIIPSNPRRQINESTLNNAIHDLWKQENFRISNLETEWDLLEDNNPLSEIDDKKLPDHIYQRMVPALQLATLMLRQSRQFLLRVVFGEIRNPPSLRAIWRATGDSHNRHLRKTAVLDQDREISASDAATYDNTWLPSFASKYRILLPRMGAGPGTLGRSRAIASCHKPFLSEVFEYYLAFFSSGFFESTPAHVRQAASFCFATTLVHEFVHVAWLRRTFKYTDQQIRTANPPLNRKLSTRAEPLYRQEDQEIELGDAWETFFFGGAVHPNQMGEEDDEREFSSGLSWHKCNPWDDDTNLYYADHEPYLTAITAESISRFFSAEAWRRHDAAWRSEEERAQSDSAGPDQALSLTLTPLIAMQQFAVEGEGSEMYHEEFGERLDASLKGRQREQPQ